MAEKITFNTGAKSYEIVDQDGNELGVFRFVPTDVGILNRYKETAAFFASVGDKIKGEDLEEKRSSRNELKNILLNTRKKTKQTKKMRAVLETG